MRDGYCNILLICDVVNAHRPLFLKNGQFRDEFLLTLGEIFVGNEITGMVYKGTTYFYRLINDLKYFLTFFLQRNYSK